MGRIQRAVTAAMAEVAETSNVAEALMLQAATEGVIIQIDSIAGIPIPATKIRIRIADKPVDDTPVNENETNGN